MDVLLDRRVGEHRFVAAATDRRDGDLHPRRVSPTVLSSRQRALTAAHWVMADQVHGTDVVHVGREPAWPLAGRGDVLAAGRTNRPVAVWAADCAAVALFGRDGSITMFHAGWRGLAADVVDEAVAQVAASGDAVAVAVLGPVIHPCCYEFGAADLATVAAGVSAPVDVVTGSTTAGQRALDVPTAVEFALARHGVALDEVGPCTGCDDRWFSHRVRHDAGRHALVAWTERLDLAR